MNNRAVWMNAHARSCVSFNLASRVFAFLETESVYSDMSANDRTQ